MCQETETKTSVQGHAYVLRNRPSRTSPLVKGSRSAILLDIHPKTITQGIRNLSDILSSLKKSFGFDSGENGIQLFVIEAAAAFHTTLRVLEVVHNVSELILHGQKDIVDAMEQHQSSAVQGLLQRSEKLVECLHPLISQICNKTAKAVDLAGETIDDMLASATEDEYQARKLNDSLIEVRATRAKAWLAHNALIEKMIATGKEYAHAACEERRLWRLALAAKTVRLATWVRIRVCGGKYPLTDPDSAESAADEALQEKREILTRRYQIQAEALEVIRVVTDNGNAIVKGEREMRNLKRHAAQMGEMTKMAKNGMVMLMRIGSLCAQTKSELETVLSDTNLLRQFFHRTCQSPGTVSNNGVLDAVNIETFPPWRPGRALARSIVQLFARWAAIADVFGDILNTSQQQTYGALSYSDDCDESVRALMVIVETRMEEMQASYAACTE